MKTKSENKSAGKIKRLIFACDQNTVYWQEGSDQETEKDKQMIRPTLETANLLKSSYENNIRATFLVDNKIFQKHSHYVPDTVEFYSVGERSKIKKEDMFIGSDESPENVLLISADRSIRAKASRSGIKSVPHPSMAEAVIEGKELYFCSLYGLLTEIRKCPDFVPYHLQRSEGMTRAIGSITAEGIAFAASMRVSVTKYPIDLSLQDPILVKVDEWNEDAIKEISKHHVLAYHDHEALIAINADDENDVVRIHGMHGHNLFLMPDPGLLIDAPANESDSAFFAPSQHQLLTTMDHKHLEVLEAITDIHLDLDLLFPRCPMSAAEFQQTVDRYSGVSPLDGMGNIASREVRHPDNPRVVQALLKELRDMGYCAWTHNFTYGGRTVKNVIAELPGRGVLRIRPEIIEKIRNILRYPKPEPGPPPFDELEKILGREWSGQLYSQSPYKWDHIRIAETQLKLYHHPWWLCLYPWPGFGAKTIVVGCHLDGTAASSPGYNPSSDPAPGADDDASGIAGTLAVAKFLASYRGKLTHTVQFCFFNAEEVGIIGSQAYASYLKSMNTPVKAAICMDMIGYNSDVQRIFEVHAGYTDPAIRDLSVPIADQIALSAAEVGQLAPAQIYKGTIGTSNPNRDTHDGAINRSDHSSFHAQGYPAVVVSEDFFVNQSGEPGSDGNPNYHRSGDTVIDSAYGAGIACAVARAVKKLAM